MTRFARWSALAVAVASLAACTSVNPATGERQFTAFMSPAKEAIVGAAFPQPYAPAPKGAAKPDPIAARPGMLFEFHPNIFVPGLGAAAIGDMVLVTETGNEILTQFARQLSIW